MRSARRSLIGAVLIGAFSLWMLGAPAAAHADQDPPDRVARLSVVDGDVGLQPAGAQGWAQAQLNRPLTTGDRLWVSSDARAELEMGGAEIRLDGDTGFGFLDLGDNHAQAQLTQGTLNLRVRRLYQGQSYEIDTPTLAFVTDQTGEFRIDIGPGGRGTQVTVYRGEARVYGRDQAQQTLYAGQSYRFEDSALTSVETFGIPQEDSFDRWCFTRDRRLDRALADRYVPEGVIGAADLDEYGNWQSVSDYGTVWYPRDVPVGWAPYRDGHWVYVAPWGWTWVDDAPWGFAPFHYGRWVWVDDAWGWLPGPRFVRPCYAPALVAFVGGGWSVGVSVGGPPIGWYPLGPDDIYRPWYYGGPRYFQQVNITNIRIVNQTVIQRVDRDYDDYRHGRPPRAGPGFGHGDRPIPPRALTVVPRDVFVGARPVAGHLLRGDRLLNTADRGSLRQVSPPRPLPVSLIGAAGHPAPRVPQGLFERQVLAHRAPPPAFNAGLAPGDRALAAERMGVRRGEPVALRPQAPAATPVRVLGGAADMAHAARPRPSFQSEPGVLPQPQRLQPAERFTGRTGGSPTGDTGLPAGVVPSARWAPHAWQSGHRPAPSEFGGRASMAPSRPSADYGRPTMRPDRPASSPWRGNPPPSSRPEAGDAPPQSRSEPAYPHAPAYRPAYGNADGGRAPSRQSSYRPEPAYAPPPAYRPEPAGVPRPAHRPEPVYAPQPAYRPEPAYRQEPAQPAYRPEPAYVPQPAVRPAPAPRAEPSRSSPRPADHHDGGGVRDG